MNTRDRSRWLAERVRAERDRHPTVDALFEMADFLFSRVIIAAAVLNARLSLGARSSDPPASDARTDPDREAPTNLP